MVRATWKHVEVEFKWLYGNKTGCKQQGFPGVTSACIAAGKKSKNPTTRRRANLAQTLRGMRRRRRR